MIRTHSYTWRTHLQKQANSRNSPTLWLIAASSRVKVWCKWAKVCDSVKNYMTCSKCNWVVQLASKQEELHFSWGTVFWGSIDPRYRALKADVILPGEIECVARNSLLNGDDDCSSIVLNQQCEMVSSLTRTYAKNFWSLISVINLTIFWAPCWKWKICEGSSNLKSNHSKWWIFFEQNFFKREFQWQALNKSNELNAMQSTTPFDYCLSWSWWPKVMPQGNITHPRNHNHNT